MATFPMVSLFPTDNVIPHNKAIFISKPTVYAPCLYNEVETNWPLPVFSREYSAAEMAAAAEMPVLWSPIPPR